MSQFLSTYLALIFLLLGCSSASRTTYHPQDKKGGYRHEQLNDNLQVVNFKANTRTKKSYSELFAKFRAVELCNASNFKVAHIIGVIDKSQSKEITRTTGNTFGNNYGFPSYYYGMSPFHRYRSGIGFSMGINSVQSRSWNETVTAPETDVIYACANVVYEPNVIFREASAEEMKHLVKDLKGALQVEKLLTDSPNQNILQEGDIVLKSNNRRLQKVYQLLELFVNEEGGKDKTVELLRDGERMQVAIKARDMTSEAEKAQKAIIHSACDFEEIKDRKLCK